MDVLILRYLIGTVDADQTVKDFETINRASDLNWTFHSHVAKFIRRFWKDPYREADREWIQKLVESYDIKAKSKFTALVRLI